VSEAALMKAIELNGVSIEFNKQAFVWGRNAAHDWAAVERLAKLNDTAAQVIDFKRTPSLDELIATRAEFLTKYQDAAYAKQYRDFVEQVRKAEQETTEQKQLRLTEAVARYLFKLMAYKDEYEVARLHSDAAFQAKIGNMFEGDYKLKFHLAPPLLAKRDADGHLVKQEFGPWMMKAFGVLAKLKFLRGSAFDIFGYTEERKTERALIAQYRDTIAALLPRLKADNLAKAVAIASIPEEIRGFGHVKERHLKAAKEKEASLLKEFDAPKTAPASSQHAA
jgi:indolepyruvate ferredoxin oxidoreductase